MNLTREYLSLELDGFRSITNSQFWKITKVMLFASTLQSYGVYGFVSKARISKPSMFYPTRVFTPATTTITKPRTGTRNSAPFNSQSFSSLGMSKPKHSSCIKKDFGDDFHSISLSIPTMETMEEVGALIAVLSQQTDVLFLDGDLGAGKTTFSRGFIKCKLGIVDDSCDYDEDSEGIEQGSLRITSPTYLLSNTYQYREEDDSIEMGGRGREKTREIHHMDLYRLSGKSSRDFDALDLDHVFMNCISLIEWPSRLQSFPELLPPEETLLKIDIRIPDPTSDDRVMSLVSSLESSWTSRLNYLIDEGMVDDLILSDDVDSEPSTGDDTLDCGEEKTMPDTFNS